MSKPGIREARRQAFANAAALIENSDLEQLFGDFWSDNFDTNEAPNLMEQAQREVVAYLRKRVPVNGSATMSRNVP